ncbi:MAG: MFS transporter [Gemmatimonadales bacterium]|nr:MFS transporter [Gemmatimonadales bacterium]
MSTSHSRPSALDRALRVFTDIRAGEAPTALLLMLNIFLIFVAYSIMKVLREVLVLSTSGVEGKALSSGGQALVLLGAVPLYGIIASRVPRRRLINIVTSFFVVCLAVFYLLYTLQLPIGIAFYIWLGIFNVMVIAQFWAFANDVYTTEEGKRLFPIVGFGSASGAVVGAWTAGALQNAVGVGFALLIAGGLLLLGVAVTNVIDSRERRRTEAHVPDIYTTGTLPAATGQFRAVTGELKAPSREYLMESGTFKALSEDEDVEATDEPPPSTGGAFQLVWRNRYLLLMALLVLLLNWVNTSGELILSAFVSDAAERAAAAGLVTKEEVLGHFYSLYQGTVNLLGMLLQLFVVSRVIKYLKIPAALLILPIVSFAAYSLILFVPFLAAVRWAKTAENSTDYSLNNTVRHALLLPTTREEKYKGKQVVDSFSQRAGDVLAALTWLGGTALLGLGYTQLAAVNLLLVAVWIVIAVRIGRRYTRLAAATRL